MNLDEARSLLGIDPSTDAGAARRAYLRLLKQHPPERDPEGFKRVRSAYEAVQRFLPPANAHEVAASSPAAAMHAAPLPKEPVQSVAVEDLAGGTPPAPPTPPPSLSELFWSEADPAVQEGMARAAVAQEHSEEAYSLLLDALADRASDAEQLHIAREAVQHGHGEFLLVIGQRWPAALSDAELSLLSKRAAGGPDWARVACILIERDRPASAGQLALSELAREKRDPFAPRANTWWLTKVVVGLLGSAEVTPALQVFHAVSGHADNEHGGVDPVRWLLLRELASVRADLPDEVARILARGIDSGDTQGAELDLAAFAGTVPKRTSTSLRRLLKQRAPSLSSYFDKSLGGIASTFRQPWYRRDWGFPTWGFLFLLNLMRMAYNDCASDSASVPAPAVETPARPTPDVEKVLCEQPGPVCDAALRWSRAQDCGAMRAAFEALQLAYVQADKVATASMRQQIAYSKASKDTAAHCPASGQENSP